MFPVTYMSNQQQVIIQMLDGDEKWENPELRYVM